MAFGVRDRESKYAGAEATEEVRVGCGRAQLGGVGFGIGSDGVGAGGLGMGALGVMGTRWRARSGI